MPFIVLAEFKNKDSAERFADKVKLEGYWGVDIVERNKAWRVEAEGRGGKQQAIREEKKSKKRK